MRKKAHSSIGQFNPQKLIAMLALFKGIILSNAPQRKTVLVIIPTKAIIFATMLGYNYYNIANPSLEHTS